VHGRRTTRQHQALEEIAFALGGEAGARLAAQLGLTISPDTLLRYIRRVPDPQALPLSVLGVDDWAWRRRYRYGTILVDLQRHRVVDLLEDRSSVSFANWLHSHPRVRIISRDRGGEYAEGASQGAPDAVQVADRFHLIKNLSEAVEKVFERHIPLLARIPMPDSPPRMLSPPRPDREASRERTRNKTIERSQMIHSLARKGMNKSAIARALGLNRKTVSKYLRTETVPERPRHRGKASMLTPYEGYILERCRQGYWNAMGLWREVVSLGYPGKYKNVSRLVAHLRKLSEEGASAHEVPAPLEGLTPRKALGLLLKRTEDRSEGQQFTIKALLALHPEIERAARLFEDFARIVRSQASEELEEWM